MEAAGTLFLLKSGDLGGRYRNKHVRVRYNIQEVTEKDLPGR